MNLIDVTKVQCSTNYVMHTLHSHPYYEIFFLTKGKRQVFSSNRLYTVNAMSMLIIPPHETHKMEGEAYERYTLATHPLFLDETELKLINGNSSTVIPIQEEYQQTILVLLNNLFEIQETEKQKSLKANYLFHSIFKTLLYLATKSYAKTQPQIIKNDLPPLLNNIIKFLDANYGQKILLDDLATEFFVSKSTILYNFKKYLQCSPIDYLLSIRLINAKKFLLSKNKHTITEISELCGFSSSNYFTEIFKDKEGLSPSNYRKFHIPTAHYNF